MITTTDERAMTAGGRALSPAMGRSGRGVTLLEVVLAVVMLGLVSAAVTATMTFAATADARCDERLSAYEVANRLALQYLDQRTLLPDGNLPLQYGRFDFLWDVHDEKFEMKITAPDSLSSRAPPRGLDRFERITVRLWRAQKPTREEAMAESGTNLIRGELLAELVRVLDPIAPRTHDAAARMATPAGIEDLSKRLLLHTGDQGIVPPTSSERGTGDRGTRSRSCDGPDRARLSTNSGDRDRE